MPSPQSPTPKSFRFQPWPLADFVGNVMSMFVMLFVYHFVLPPDTIEFSALIGGMFGAAAYSYAGHCGYSIRSPGVRAKMISVLVFLFSAFAVGMLTQLLTGRP